MSGLVLSACYINIMNLSTLAGVIFGLVGAWSVVEYQIHTTEVTGMI